MTDLQTFVAPTYDGLADVLASAPTEAWDAPSLCAGWQVRHVIAHVTMAARFTPEQFGAELARRLNALGGTSWSIKPGPSHSTRGAPLLEVFSPSTRMVCSPARRPMAPRS